MNPTIRNLGPTINPNTVSVEHKMNIASTSYDTPLSPLKHNLPCADLLGNKEDYFRLAVPLYEASITGDWKAAKALLDYRPELVTFAINKNYETALHVAVSTEDTRRMEEFVQNLVDRMKKTDLEFQNQENNTALHLAVAAGNVKIAKIMMKKNMDVVGIPGSKGMMPLYVAALFGKHNMMKHLYDNSKMMSGDLWTDMNRGWVVMQCVEADMFDVALKIVTDRPELAIKPDLLQHVLLILASKSDVFNRTERNVILTIIYSFLKFIHVKVGVVERDSEALCFLRIICENLKIMPDNEIDNILRGPPSRNVVDSWSQYSSRILFVAAEMGNARLIVELIRAYPDLVLKKNEDGLSIFHVAVKHRHRGIYNLLYEIGSLKHVIITIKDKDGNNMLHLVGMTSVEMRSETYGASLLMQRELLWFKEVEKMVPPVYRRRKNNAGQTPYELFSKENEDVVSQGLKWMKDCMVVATLIVTVAFAVAFTVPGGYNQINGIPMFIHERSFIIFVIADAISLFASSASLLVFLSILTSRHGQRDFMNSLPRKLMIGLGTLFISVIAMMVTFSASFFVLYHNSLKWVPTLIAALATMPVLLFAILQSPLLVDMFRSMYDPRYLFKPKKHVLYNPNRKLKLL